MKRFIPAISLSIIFGMIISWLERAVPLFNLGPFNSVNIAFLSFLISLLVVLLIASFAGTILSSILSVFLFVASYIGVCFYLGISVDFPLIVRLGIVFISGIWLSLFLYSGRAILSKSKEKVKIGQDIAFALIFFFASILFALAVTLMEENVIAFDITKIFYGYLYFLVSVLLLFAFFSFNEVAGFLIGLGSLPVYFLSMRLVKSNFDFRFLILNEREFLIIVGVYSLLFAFSTMLMAGSGRIFVKAIRSAAKRKEKIKKPSRKQPIETEKKLKEIKKLPEKLQQGTTEVEKTEKEKINSDKSISQDVKKDEKIEEKALKKQDNQDSKGKTDSID